MKRFSNEEVLKINNTIRYSQKNDSSNFYRTLYQLKFHNKWLTIG